jgi:hypothetical protein
MNFFSDFTFHWWQIGLIKISLIALGILIGSYRAGFFRNKIIAVLLWLAFLIPAVYSAFVALQQTK